MIPFFGWIRVNCGVNEQVDLVKCECGPSRKVPTQSEETTSSLPGVTKSLIVPDSSQNKEQSLEKTSSTKAHQTFTTSVAPVDPSPNKMTSSYPKTLSTTLKTTMNTSSSKIKSTTYPSNSVIYQPKVTPKIDLSIFLPPKERLNQTEDPKGDLQTLFSLLDLSNSTSKVSNSALLIEGENKTANETLEDNMIDSAIISLLDNDLEVTKKTFEEKLISSKVGKTSSEIPSYLHKPEKSKQNSSALLPLVLPSTLTLIDTALKTMSNKTEPKEEKNITMTNETTDGSNVMSSRKKIISLLQAENSIQTNIISFLKNTTATKSDILDNYTHAGHSQSNESSVDDHLPSESDVIKNSSKSALLIKLLNMENTLQSKLISLLNKENFLLGHADYDYPDLPTLPPLVPESTTAAGPHDGFDTTTPSLENITTQSDVLDLFKTDSELESAIAILMHAKSADGAAEESVSVTEPVNPKEKETSGKLTTPLTTTLATPIVSSSYTTVSSTNPRSPSTTSSMVTSLNPSPTKISPLVTTSLQITRMQIPKLAFPPLSRTQRKRIRISSRRRNLKNSDRDRLPPASNMLTKTEKESKTKLTLELKDVSEKRKVNVTRHKTLTTSAGLEVTSKVTSLPNTSSSSIQSSLNDSKKDKSPQLTIVLRKVVQKDTKPPSPEVAGDKNTLGKKIKVF